MVMNTTMMLTKEKFLSIIDDLKRHIDYDNECDYISDKYNIDYSQSNVSSLSFIVTDLLDIILDKEYDHNELGDVTFFVHVLDFGRNYKPGSIIYIDKEGNKIDVDLSSAEKLWDYLVEYKGE